MPEHKFNEFEQIIIRSGNELGAAVLLILAWIAASDGTIDKKEIKKLSDISSAAKYAQEIEPLLRLVKNRNINALQLACEIVNRHFRGDKANLFIEMAIGMAISDGYLLPTENHILRFLADLLGIGNSGLNALFVEITGSEIPYPSDVSSAKFWRSRAKTNSGSTGGSNTKNDSQHTSKTEKMAQAYAVLGLRQGATMEEIRKTYYRLAQIHHPDRFASLGEEAVAAATNTFQRINEAYEFLVKHA